MLSKMHNREEGFTLIELMIVIAIIGILAAIAIPQFNAYRARSYNASANTDLRNAITVQEGWHIDHGAYTTTEADLTSSNYGLVLSDGVEFTIDSADTTTYVMHAYNDKAGGRAVTYSISGPSGDITKSVP